MYLEFYSDIPFPQLPKGWHEAVFILTCHALRMKDFRIGDLAWNLADDDIEKLYPELKLEERAKAAENLSRYFKVIGKVYDHLDDEGKLKDTLLLIQYKKRNRKNTESQYETRESDDIPTSTGDSNEFTS